MNTNKQIKSTLDKYQKPSLTVDILLFSVIREKLHVLFVKRSVEPQVGTWALPGGFVAIDTTLEDTARNKLLEKTGIDNVYLEQLYTFGELDRDPRTRVVTVAYFALVPHKSIRIVHSESSEEIQWFPVNSLPMLAFDHKKIVKYGIERLRAKVGYSNIVFGLLPELFRLSELQKYYEVILGHELDKRNFRKKMMATGLLTKTNKLEIEGAHRPAALYKFKKREVVWFD